MVRVLVCEDDDDIRRLVAELLSAVGDDVVTTADVTGALHALDGDPFEVVVTDLGLPDGSGAEVCCAATAAGARVVVMTANVDLLGQPCLASADTVLHKPFSAARLLAAVGAA